MEAANKLFDALGEQLVKNDIARFKSLLHNSPLPPGMLEECKTFSDICQRLVVRKKIQPDVNDFEILKNLFRQMNKMTLVDMITDHERAHANANDGPGYNTRSKRAKQVETGAQAPTPVQNTMCAISDDGSDEREKEDNQRRTRKLHADLSVDLKRIIQPDQLASLIMHVQTYLAHGELDGIKTFDDLWRELNNRGEISPGIYGILESALETIHPSHFQIIQEFKEKMKSEDGRYDGWIRDNITVKSVDELKRLTKNYRIFMGEEGRHGVVFKNAGLSLIGAEGGELRLPNGSAALEVPPQAVERETLFWMFLGQENENQFFLRAANEPLADSDGIAKYSFPVRLGPTGLEFMIPAMLKLRDFSKPSTEKAMSVYRRTKGGSLKPKPVGSCFYDRDHSNNYTASMSLKHFSGYILGMSVLSNPAPLNVRVMVHREAGTNGDWNQIKVFFSANDYDYNQELIRSNSINAECTTCFYVDPRRDVNVILIRRHDKMTSDRRNEVVLHQQYIENLPEMPVFLTICTDSDGSSRSQDQDCQDTLIIEQTGQSLLHQSIHWSEEQPFNQRLIAEAVEMETD